MGALTEPGRLVWPAPETTASVWAAESWSITHRQLLGSANPIRTLRSRPAGTALQVGESRVWSAGKFRRFGPDTLQAAAQKFWVHLGSPEFSEV